MAECEAEAIFQTSTMASLIGGVYDGVVTVRELLDHGDFGLGTFNGLDGEMLVLNGACYRLRANGTAERAAPEALTPFAAVTWFRGERSLQVSQPHDRAALQALVDKNAGTRNLMVSVRVSGEFGFVRTRTVTTQHRPYRPFVEAAKDQQEVIFSDVSGTMAGFRMPVYEQGVSVAGYHSHFIDDSKQRGGHVLDCRLIRGVVEFGVSSQLCLSLQRSPQFLDADLDIPDLDSQIRETEGG